MNLPLRSALLAVGLLTGGAGARDVDASAIRIELLPEVTVEHADVMLGEIAQISSSDAAMQERLAELPLGRAPQAGDVVELGRDTLMRWIRARLEIDARQITWAGPLKTKILPLTTSIRGEAIARCAQDRLSATLAESGLRADIELSQLPRDVVVPSGTLELKARTQAVLQRSTVSSGALLAKRQSVWVDLWVGGRFVRTVPVAFNVSVFAPAYVALQDLASGLVFAPGDADPAQIAVREVEWSGRIAEPIKPVSAVAPKPLPPAPTLKLRHAVHAGQPLTHADVTTAPLVTQGSYATLHSVNGPIELESRVQVLQDGVAGQTVRVKLPKASSPVLARVTGPGLVEIRE